MGTLAAPRRAALRVLAATGLGLVTLSGKGPDAAAGKHKRKHKGKKKCHKGKKHGPVTCAAVCPAEGGYAFHLLEGGDICATGADPTDCYECTTTSECVDQFSAVYACVRDFTRLATDTSGNFAGLCGPYTRGICAAFEPCVLA
jgi:hypothetical protein